ncbi:GntR family transcriptional regulator [Micromonospora sediminicola]|uniref:GntR family transcriptional regulator n=1 Tax=Micromonospora sediminicola TaxID=946078 RepID=UPI0033E35846
MSDRPTLTVDTDDPTPPYEQLRRQLADLIEYGVLAPDDRLPPLRQLAADLGLAVGTVARTYRELESAGLIVSRRGGGTRVAAARARPPAAVLHERAAAFVRDARLLGADDEQIRAAVAAALGP